MKNLINKVCDHSKRITVKLKRHHKKFLFWALCCCFLALIGVLFLSKSKADSIIDYMRPISNLTHVCDPRESSIKLKWQSSYDVMVDISIRNERANAFEKIWEVSSNRETYKFIPMDYNSDTIIRLKTRDWSQILNYTARCIGTSETLWTATWMSVTLNPGWNVFSTPALLSNISFSNGWNGISFSKLENSQWISVTPNTNVITPLEGFLVRNTNNSAVTMNLTYRDTTPNEDMLSKNVSRWRNLLWITTTDDPFYNIHPGLHLDFTKNAILNLLNSINTNYTAKNWTVEYPEIWEAYGIFLSSDGIYWWSNNRYWNNNWINNVLYNDSSSYSEIIWVTPWSYNIPLLKWRVVTDRDLSFRNTGFYLEIGWANAYEAIAWYDEAWWIIYDIVVKVWSCTSHVDKSLYAKYTDSVWHKKIFIPFFETCNTIPEWSHEISVLLWINGEYATNFKTGMTITMNFINSYYLNDAPINWEIKSSVIEVSHNNLPSLYAERLDNQIEVNITTWSNSFLLWSVNIFANEPWESVSVLFDVDRSINYDLLYGMYVDMYVNWEFVDRTLYANKMIKHVITLDAYADTQVEFRWSMISFKRGSFVPRILINSISQKDINYITYNCHYYRWRCTQFNWGNYIFNWWLFNVNWWWENIEWCSAAELLACVTAEDYDNCVYHCSTHPYGQQLDKEDIEAYIYAYDRWLISESNIYDAHIFSTVSKIELADIISKYAINVLWLEPNQSIQWCDLPSDVLPWLNNLYNSWYTKLCQLRLLPELWNFYPFSDWTYGDFATRLSRALNAGDVELLNELNNINPYYSWHLNWLVNNGIMTPWDWGELAISKEYALIYLMRWDDNYSPIPESCTANDLLECIQSDDYDDCIAGCSQP